jgi:hypothetical protein
MQKCFLFVSTYPENNWFSAELVLETGLLERAFAGLLLFAFPQIAASPNSSDRLSGFSELNVDISIVM